MTMLIVLALTAPRPLVLVQIEENEVIRDRSLDHLHVMAELAWAERCREDER